MCYLRCLLLGCGLVVASACGTRADVTTDAPPAPVETHLGTGPSYFGYWPGSIGCGGAPAETRDHSNVTLCPAWDAALANGVKVIPAPANSDEIEFFIDEIRPHIGNVAAILIADEPDCGKQYYLSNLPPGVCDAEVARLTGGSDKLHA